jgi:hypothetical protein
MIRAGARQEGEVMGSFVAFAWQGWVFLGGLVGVPIVLAKFLASK